MKNINKDKVIIAILIVLFAFYGFFINNNKNNNAVNKIENSENNLESNSTVDDSEMYIHIDGEVINPGLYEFQKDDRIDDAIKKAGGLTDSASTKNINLSQRLEDEMKINIPSNDSNQDNMTTENSNISLININSATKDELMSLPGIGETRANSIIEYREESSFKKIEDIMNISGIGEKTFEALEELITI